MTSAITAAVLFALGGIIVSAVALTKDEVNQGIYGHVAFYLYLLSIASILFGSLSGLTGLKWTVLIYVSLVWIVVGRVLTLLRYFKVMTYFQLVAGIITLAWIVFNIFS
ncbi:hypothetical protein LCGC14_1750510 [marine sediment metagenome]|uniref:Uncharacterized protein n=1 Tax=marine sediment metagenome TaxID=412755 RepID=A0A0F9JJ72_9ZZZZ|nr:hypothetical protein [Actinomycetota bacterium]